MRGDQHSYAVAGSVNWDSFSGRHFGNVYEKSLRRHIPFDPVILCIKKIYPKEKIDPLHMHVHIKYVHDLIH